MDKTEKLNRWIEHSELYAGKSSVSAETLQSLPNMPTWQHLDAEPDIGEVTSITVGQAYHR